MKKAVSIITVSVIIAGGTGFAKIIASDSFSSGNVSGDYTDKKPLGDPVNARVLEGVTGFKNNTWGLSASGTITIRKGKGLTHDAVQGRAADGYLQIIPPVQNEGAAISRKTRRVLSPALTGPVFYMSGLINIGSLRHLNIGEKVAMGVSDAAQLGWDGVNGIFIGAIKDDSGDVFYAVFAGENTYKLGAAVTAEQAFETQMLIVRWEAGSARQGGVLTAWVVAQNDKTATQILNIENVSAGRISDYKSVIVQVHGGLNKTYSTGIKMDEFRLGSEWNDVTSASK
ncbi:MAG: hypothetical protein WC959_08180 [Kiritimatiellales bacterium]